jgi:hypothetical protein
MGIRFTNNASVGGGGYEGHINIEDHGASSGNDAASNKTAIEAAIVAARALNYGIYVPPKTYVTNGCTHDIQVPVKGASIEHSILKNNDWGIILNAPSTEFEINTSVRDITFQGVDSQHGTGMVIESSCGVDFQHVQFRNFDDGLVMRGVLVGGFTRCRFHTNRLHGVRTENDPDSDIGAGLSCAHITFDQCVANGNWLWAFKLQNFGNVVFRDLDAEDNGQFNNPDTGVIQLVNTAASNSLGRALKIDGAWMERNRGTLIDLPEAASKYVTHFKSNIKDVTFQFNKNTSNDGLVNLVRLTAATNKHDLVIEDSFMDYNGAAGLVTNGANARTYAIRSEIQAHTELNSGIYIAS